MEQVKKNKQNKLLNFTNITKTNPFSGCLLVLIQIPIIFALYYVFLKGIKYDGGLLYSFIPAPEHINMVFLGVLDISQKSLILAILAGISQYFQAPLCLNQLSQKKYWCLSRKFSKACTHK